jgi:alkylation response protein AidB-like acyl-CoA dehydrogenase
VVSGVAMTEGVTDVVVRELVDRLLAEHADDDETTFLGAQFDAGLARMDYPIGLGGLDAEPALQEIVDEALQAAGRRYPWIRNAMGIGMCGPTIVARGTREQQERFLRPIFTADEIWCQLFSEPGAGSDVAGLSTSAVRDGDQWIINGSKVWTSQAHKASYGLLLARTDPDAPKHKGLTAFIVDMHEPGVEVRGIRSMAGGSGFNEVFFTDSVVPDSMRIGEVGEGWRVANATLMNERVSIGSEVAPRGAGPIARAVETWAEYGDGNAVQRDRLMRLWVDAEVLRLGSLRAQAKREKGVPGPEGSILKLLQGRLLTDVAELVVDMMGPRGTLLSGPYTREQVDEREAGSSDPVLAFVGVPAATIAGGTTQIQMNIIGERVLGLPREPGIDPDTPWSRIPRN